MAQEPRRRPEAVRFLLFLLVNLALGLVFTVAQPRLITMLMVGELPMAVSIGEGMYILSLAANYLPPVIAVLVNRRVTFRSRAPWWVAVIIMLALRALWQLAFTFLMTRMMADFDADLYSEMAMVMNLIWLAGTYLFQRFLLFRNTIDTL